MFLIIGGEFLKVLYINASSLMFSKVFLRAVALSLGISEGRPFELFQVAAGDEGCSENQRRCSKGLGTSLVAWGSGSLGWAVSVKGRNGEVGRRNDQRLHSDSMGFL